MSLGEAARFLSPMMPIRQGSRCARRAPIGKSGVHGDLAIRLAADVRPGLSTRCASAKAPDE
jgi:hypothetical protein